MEWASTTTGLIVVPAPPGPNQGRLDRHRAGVPVGSASGVGVLTAGTTQLPVHLDPLPEVPAGCVAVGEETAARLGIGDGLAVPWTLRAVAAPPLDELHLEVQVESQLDDVVDRLNRTGDLADRLLWLPAGVNIESLWLTVDGVPFRVRDVSPVPLATGDAAGTAMRVTEQTRVTVFAPGVKTGVDIIVLADCSGSMSVKDLTDTSDATRGQPLERAEALRRALGRLLDVRLQTAGRVSRVAVVRFTDKCGDADILFPPSGGGRSSSMAEIDGRSPPGVVGQFRSAIGLLQAQNAGTHIGTALNFAAELLHQHGHPGNDRLIVLLSDGGSQPKGEDTTGEEVGGLDDEVSLMEHLHRAMNVRLHAIGISTEPLYHAYRARRGETGAVNPGYVPNHQLLTRLMAVGGGDPAQMGDADVLESYFSGLGGGVERQVRPPRSVPPPPLSADERKALAVADRKAVSGPVLAAAADREKLAGELRGLYSNVNLLASLLAGERLFDAHDGMEVVYAEAQHPVATYRDFETVVNRVYKASFDTLCRTIHSDLGAWHKWNGGSQQGAKPAFRYKVPGVVELTADGLIQDFRKLRHWNNHNLDKMDPRDKTVVADFLMAAVQTVTPADDPAVCVRLHREFLTRFRDILTRYVAVFRAEEERRKQALTAPAQLTPAAPAGTKPAPALTKFLD